MESILTSIKKLLGISEDYEHFDNDIIMHINSTFFVLNELGVGPDECFTITDKYAKWTDFMPDSTSYELVKSYMYLKVKLLFDPPLTAAVLDNIKKMIDEHEFRLNVAAESKQSVSEEGIQNG